MSKPSDPNLVHNPLVQSFYKEPAFHRDQQLHFFSTSGWGLLVALLGLLPMFFVVQPEWMPKFISNAIFGDVLEYSLIIAPLGMLFALGHFDLSVAGMVAFSGSIFAVLLDAGAMLWVVLIILMVNAVLLGGGQGISHTKLRLPSMLVSLVLGFSLRGFAMQLIDFRTIQVVQSDILTATVWVLSILIIAVIVILGQVALSKNNQLKTQFYPLVILFALSALGASMAGVASATRLQSVSTSAGNGMEIYSVAILLVSGIRFASRRVNFLGLFLTMLGVLLFKHSLDLMALDVAFQMSILFGFVTLGYSLEFAYSKLWEHVLVPAFGFTQNKPPE